MAARMFQGVVGVLVCCLLPVLIQGSIHIPVFSTSGTYYQVGFNTGEHFKSQIQDYFLRSTKLNDKLLPYIRTEAGFKIFAGYFAAVRKIYPQYFDELTGIADGARMQFTSIFTMSIENELNAHIDGLWKTEHCSDVHINYPEQVAIGHNEDADPLIKERAYFINATIIQDGKILEKYTAYTYPGSLPGNAFGFNTAGLIFALNGLYPTLVGDNKIPRNYINRALLGQQTKKGVRNVLDSNNIGGAYAFSVNFADLTQKEKLTYNYEVTPLNNLSISLVSERTVLQDSSGMLTGLYDVRGHYYHFNKFEHPDTINIEQFPKSIVSSIHRRKRAEQLPVPTDITGIKNILGDTGDSQFPIYRTPSHTDSAATVATALFDVTRCKLNIFTDNPKLTDPVMTFDLPNCL